ncbi:3-deoxy-7-phosphoheptulonate synthase [Massilia sp. PAMC28688]|uniref:3-deoxy-7-phosphoheptulonate synthase n=1 Tax=Massilia sp. PAMC28688 TaxID=2861283 RepID=UPI001C6367BA|nr:3-deoxy-7-phosphoheptulonate synthase [Massilia sp. PAMC28688]QYF95655.1 3-deoxy-7-phosphoheptulonate synthase [Massilia sp. PAMC28688]
MKRDFLAEPAPSATSAMPSPAQLRAGLPCDRVAAATVAVGRATICDILARRDRRLLVVVGPCSIHDPAAALDYASRLAQLAREVQPTLYLVMRVYFEKPRTSTGWKGLINDPHMDQSFRIPEGMQLARGLLLDVARLGVPAAVEALDPMSPQYLADLVSWAAIGARTTESQTHREMASSLPLPVGFKNGTDGGVGGAINAIRAASRPHAFLGLDADGRAAVVRTRGNANIHLILRGGSAGPNFDAASVAGATRAMQAAGLDPAIMVDCSHGNAGKDHRRQITVLEDVVRQRHGGNRDIIGVMLESFIEAGSQPLSGNLRYGCSVTDPCLDWADTARALRAVHRALERT